MQQVGRSGWLEVMSRDTLAERPCSTTAIPCRSNFMPEPTSCTMFRSAFPNDRFRPCFLPLTHAPRLLLPPLVSNNRAHRKTVQRFGVTRAADVHLMQ